MNSKKLTPGSLTIISVALVFLSALPMLIPAFSGKQVDEFDIILSIVLLIMSDKISDYIRDTLNNQSNQNLSRAIKSSFNCEYVGSSLDAASHISQKIQYAKKIRNTYVNYTEITPFDYPKNIQEQLESAMVHFFKNKSSSWEDVIGGQLGSFYMRFFRTFLAVEPSSWRVDRLKVEYPIINFIILRYGDSQRSDEVLFGWGHTVKDPIGEVFRSTDSAIIALFSNYFDSLQLSSERLGSDEILALANSFHSPATV